MSKFNSIPQQKKRLNLNWLYSQLEFHKNLNVDGNVLTQELKDELIYNIQQAILREKNK